MAKKTGALIGWRPCRYVSLCKNQRAEVRKDKSGNPYVICLECEPMTQEFSFGHKSKVEFIMGAGFMPIPNDVKPEPVREPAPPPPPPPAPSPAPKKKGSGLLIGGDNDN